MSAYSVIHPHNGMFTGLAILPYQQTVDDPSSRRVSLQRGVSLAMLISMIVHVICSCKHSILSIYCINHSYISDNSLNQGRSIFTLFSEN